MNEAAWERLTDAIDIKCGITEHGKSQRPLEDKPDLEEQITYICFNYRDSEYKLERIGRPAVIDRKSHYSSRPGVANRIENIYDTSELSYQVTLYQKEDDDWVEKNLEELQLG